MQITQTESERREHPVDIVERLASINEWLFEREDEDEIAISVSGRWTEYHIAYTWLPDLETMHVGCAFDLKAPEHRRAEVLDLVSLINEQMWLGHFDLWRKEGVVMFRHGLLLSGGAQPSAAQLESILSSAITACERYYQAFQFVVWAGKSAKDAVKSALFETAGEA